MKLPNFVIKNKYTNNSYEFGSDHPKRKLISELDVSDVEKSNRGYLEWNMDNFTCLADPSVSFTDNSGKKRNVKHSRDDIVGLLNQIIDFHYKESDEIINYTHDIQYLVGALVHNSIVKKGQSNDVNFLANRLEKIHLISIVISAKNTYFRYLTEDISFLKPTNVDLLGKTYKIANCIPFLSESAGKNITFKFVAERYIQAQKCMINIFDFMPFQIIENAIKYGPKDDEIEITVSANSNCITIEFSSMGPKLCEGESILIFEKGYRGHYAKKLESRGHGLGLAQTKKALQELVDGTVSVRQRDIPSFTFDGIPFCETVFCFQIPK